LCESDALFPDYLWEDLFAFIISYKAKVYDPLLLCRWTVQAFRLELTHSLTGPLDRQWVVALSRLMIADHAPSGVSIEPNVDFQLMVLELFDLKEPLVRVRVGFDLLRLCGELSKILGISRL